jgi:hypothetical protein
MCLGAKHTLTNGGECKRWSPMTPKCTPIVGIALVQESQMFRTLVEKTSKHKIKPSDTIGKVLKYKCLKWSCIIHLDLKCTNYDEEKGWDQIEILILDHKSPWIKGSNDLQLGHEIHCWKDFFEGYKILSSHIKKKTWFEEDMNVQSFETIRVLVLGLSLGNPRKKMPFGCSPHWEAKNIL